MRLKAMALDNVWYVDIAKWKETAECPVRVDWDRKCMRVIDFQVPKFVTEDGWIDLRTQLRAHVPSGYAIDRIMCTEYYAHSNDPSCNSILGSFYDYNRCFFYDASTAHVRRAPGQRRKLIVYVAPCVFPATESQDAKSQASESLPKIDMRSQWQALERRLELYL
jgi:hypothetical protein